MDELSNGWPANLDTYDLSEYLQVSPRTLEHLRYTGDGPPFSKVGRRVIYRRVRVDEWLAAREVNSTAETRTATSEDPLDLLEEAR